MGLEEWTFCLFRCFCIPQEWNGSLIVIEFYIYRIHGYDYKMHLAAYSIKQCSRYRWMFQQHSHFNLLQSK